MKRSVSKTPKVERGFSKCLDTEMQGDVVGKAVGSNHEGLALYAEELHGIFQGGIRKALTPEVKEQIGILYNMQKLAETEM